MLKKSPDTEAKVKVQLKLECGLIERFYASKCFEDSTNTLSSSTESGMVQALINGRDCSLTPRLLEDYSFNMAGAGRVCVPIENELGESALVQGIV